MKFNREYGRVLEVVSQHAVMICGRLFIVLLIQESNRS